MSCDIVDFPPRPPKPLLDAAEDALRLIRLAHKDLASLSIRGKVKSAHDLCGIAGDELERALIAHSQAATRDLREIVLTALGPDLKYGHVLGARRVLRMVLECIEPEPPTGEGGVA